MFDVGDLDGRLVANGELVIAGGGAAVLLVPVDPPLTGVVIRTVAPREISNWI
jgi:hypothetical protein